MRNAFRIGLAGVAALGLSLVPSPAGATPSSGVTATVIFQATVDGTNYTMLEVTIQPGGTSGWHYHPGPGYAVVTQGTLTHSNSTCATDGVYQAGDTFVEPGGADYVHIGRNLDSQPVVLKGLFVTPAGSPLTADAPNPGCDFQ